MFLWLVVVPGAARRRRGRAALAARVRGLRRRARSLGIGARRRPGCSPAAGIVLQGANAAGTSFWARWTPTVIGDVLATSFGTAWALRLLAWLLLGAALARP